MNFQTITEFRALTGQDAATPAETALIAACSAGTLCVLENGNRPETDTAARRIRAPLLRLLIVGGSDDCDLADSGVLLAGGWIIGELNLNFASGRGATGMVNCHFTHTPQMNAAKLGSLNLAGSKLPGLFAQGIKVAQSVRLSRDFHATGTVDLGGADIGGQLDCANGRFDGNGKDALNGQSLKVAQNVHFREGFYATGTVDLNAADIGGQLDCSNGRLDGNGEMALNGQGLIIAQAVFLRNGFHATGTVNLNAADIGGYLDCSNGRFNGNGEMALIGQCLIIAQAVFLRNDFHATGTVDLNGADISGQLDCTNGRFDGNGKDALNGYQVRVAAGFFWRNVKIDSGSVYLVGAHVGELVDDLASWPEGHNALDLNGLTYDRIATFTDTNQRLDWLRRGAFWNGIFHPQPYVQLAGALRSQGHIREARRVALVGEKLGRLHERDQMRVMPNGDVDVAFKSIWVDMKRSGLAVWDWFLRATVGYGLYPFRSVIGLVLLFALSAIPAHFSWKEGSMVPNSGPVLVSLSWQKVANLKNPADAWDDTNPGRDWETFSSVAWAADLVIPIIDLGQTSAWAPSTERGPWGANLWWARWVLIMAGWLVTALGAAAITGIIRRK